MDSLSIISKFEEQVDLIGSMSDVYLPEDDGFALYEAMKFTLELVKSQRLELDVMGEKRLTTTKGLHVGHKYYCSNCGKLANMVNFCEYCGAKVVNPDEEKRIKELTEEMKKTSDKYIPMISGFNDFCFFHKSGEPIYLVDGKLQAGYDLLVDIKHRYNFTDSKVQSEVEQAIQENLYMFDITESNQFFWPNDSMFSGDSSESNILGQKLVIKPKYR